MQVYVSECQLKLIKKEDTILAFNEKFKVSYTSL